MGTLSPEAIQQAVQASGLHPLSQKAAEKFASFAEVLIRWNSRLNLTALRSSEQILAQHFLECIFCAQNLAGDTTELLDFGSGAGFPGIPIALCREDIDVVLAESIGKKAAFLREAVRVLGINAEIYAHRVEDMAPGRCFAAVTLRAVDNMAAALPVAASRLKPGGNMVLLSTASITQALVVPGFGIFSCLPVPDSDQRVLLQLRKADVPRGTSA